MTSRVLSGREARQEATEARRGPPAPAAPRLEVALRDLQRRYEALASYPRPQGKTISLDKGE